MNKGLRRPRGILVILALIMVIALALVVRGFIIGETDHDEDEVFTGNVIAAYVH